MTNIAKLLNPKAIVFLKETSRNEALKTLAETLSKAKKVKNSDEFLEAILAREAIISTGIGMGVAIPHAKLPVYKHFFIAVGIQKNGGIVWDSLDGQPVRLIFMIGGPDEKQTDYLKILSALTAAIKSPERRKALLSAESPEEVIEQFL